MCINDSQTEGENGEVVEMRGRIEYESQDMLHACVDASIKIGL